MPTLASPIPSGEMSWVLPGTVELGTAAVRFSVGDEVVACGVLVLTGTGGVAAVGLSAGDEVVACGVLVLTGGEDVSWVEGLFVSPQPMRAIKKLAMRVILTVFI